MNWLIESFDEDFEAVGIVAQKYGKVVLHPCDHFDPSIQSKFLSNEPVFCYGSLQWIKEIQEYSSDHSTLLRTICNFPNFHCSKYYAYLGKFLFNPWYVMMPLSEVYRRQRELFRQYDGPFFIRPSSGYKTGPVSGTVVTPKNFDEEYQFFLEDFGPDGLMVLAAVRHIDIEWRTIVCRGKAITGCQYKTYCHETNKLGADFSEECPDKVLSFAENVAAVWQPDEMFCLDVVGAEGQLYLLEINALSTAGWYDCDTDKILQSIQTCGVSKVE